MFIEKEELLVQNKNLRAVIEEQKQTIDKLSLNIKIRGIDADTQTEIRTVDVQLQTNAKKASDSSTQTGKMRHNFKLHQ